MIGKREKKQFKQDILNENNFSYSVANVKCQDSKKAVNVDDTDGVHQCQERKRAKTTRRLSSDLLVSAVCLLFFFTVLSFSFKLVLGTMLCEEEN